ncbi:MAG: prolipoprotein diacylglyceryl transferase [Clostridia bacterium]|nr:prolipoprotein diacylglyceryl transferase [Clostridia bacterium]
MYNVQFPGMGISMTIDPVAFSIGDFKVYWYGIVIGIGFALALFFALRNLRRFGIKADGFIDCVLAGLIFGIIGARLFYVIFRWEYYSQHLDELFAIHNGGLAIYGGVIGALTSGCIVAKIKKLPILAVLDISMMGFLIGQGIGRWGNFFNQEAFGTPTDLPWRMVSENTGGVGVHPCFLYESLWCLLGFLLLWLFSRRFRKYDGQIFLMYLVWYGIERMIVEGLRTDSLYTPFLGLRVSQVIAAVTALTGIVLLIVFRKRTYKAADNFETADTVKASLPETPPDTLSKETAEEENDTGVRPDEKTDDREKDDSAE